MSWINVFKINNNLKKPLNSLIVDSTYTPIRVVTASTTYVPERNGLYRVICVGAGGASVAKSSSNTAYGSGGGGGGVAVKDIYLDSSTSYNITVSTTASFSNLLTATAGAQAGYRTGSGVTMTAEPTGGTGSGGDKNYTGEKGSYGTTTYTTSMSVSYSGGSIGCVIADLTRQHISNDSRGNNLSYGRSLLKYGGGAPAALSNYVNSEGSEVARFFPRPGLPAAVLIIPIEMED